VTPVTVRSHVSAILRKLRVTSREAAIEVARGA
jgi:DNA-binding NarL/FixJ family response regulator